MPENNIPTRWYEVSLNQETGGHDKSLFQRGSEYLARQQAEIESAPPSNKDALLSVANRLKADAREFWGYVNLPVEQTIPQEKLAPHLKEAEDLLKKKILASQRGFIMGRTRQRYEEITKECNPKLQKYLDFVKKVYLEGQAGPMVDQANTTDDDPTLTIEGALKAIESGEVRPLWSKKELLEMYFDPEENLDYEPATGDELLKVITQPIPGLEDTEVGNIAVDSLLAQWGKAKAAADAKYYETHKSPETILPASEPVSLELATEKFKLAIIKDGSREDDKNISTALAELLNSPLPQTELNSTQQVKVSRTEDIDIHEVNLGKAVTLIITQALEQHLKVLPLAPDSPTKLSFSIQLPKSNTEESLRVVSFVINASSATAKPPNRNNIVTLLSRPSVSREQIYLEEIQVYLKGARVDELTILLRDEKKANEDKW